MCGVSFSVKTILDLGVAQAGAYGNAAIALERKHNSKHGLAGNTKD